jgi:hypothetical protein
VLTGFLNSTTIAVRSQKSEVGDGPFRRSEQTVNLLSIQHGPIPARGNRALSGEEISQLYCKERSTSSKGGVSRAYEVRAILVDGRQLTLLDKLPSPDQALFIEQELERRLGIVNQPVEGELGGARG